MTSEQLELMIAKLNDAIKRDDENAGREAFMALGVVVIGSLVRIADALDHIARNVPSSVPADQQEG